MSWLALSDSFEYLCYGSTAIGIFLLLQCGDQLQLSESDVYRRQILTTKVNSRTVRVKALNYIIHLSLASANMATLNFQRVKITLICLIWDQTFANLDVYTLISFSITG